MKLSSSFTRDVVCVAYRLNTLDTMFWASALERDAGVEGAPGVVAAGAGVRCFGAMVGCGGIGGGRWTGEWDVGAGQLGGPVWCVFGGWWLAGVWCGVVLRAMQELGAGWR